jgi:hypothetical protein
VTTGTTPIASFPASRSIRVLVAGGLIVSALVSVALVNSLASGQTPDLWFYWMAGQTWPDQYDWSVWAGTGVFRYPPTTALLFVPFAWMPLEALRVLWFGLSIGALRWALGSWKLVMVAAILPPVAVDLWAGNINVIAGALLVRAPAALGLLFAFAPKPYIAILAVTVGRLRGLLLLAASALFVLVVTAIDGWRYLDILRLSAQDQGQLNVIGALGPLYVVYLGVLTAVAWVRRERPWAAPRAAALASPVVHLVYFAPACVAAVDDLSRRFADPLAARAPLDADPARAPTQS